MVIKNCLIVEDNDDKYIRVAQEIYRFSPDIKLTRVKSYRAGLELIRGGKSYDLAIFDYYLPFRDNDEKITGIGHRLCIENARNYFSCKEVMVLSSETPPEEFETLLIQYDLEGIQWVEFSWIVECWVDKLKEYFEQ